MSLSIRSDEGKDVGTNAPTFQDTVDPDIQFGGHEARKRLEKRLLLKIDLRLSILIVIYILNYIDRNNAGAAKLRGFESDLHLTGEEFPTILSILYVGYIIMQIPSNMFLNYIGKPSIYLPGCMMVWGVLSCLTGITHNFTGAVLTRFFLGFVEAAFFPGALFLLSKWYKRDELGFRTAILYCGNIISNAFGNLMASGILSDMQGTLGHSAWRWLFYIEGSLTCFTALIAMFILPDFPETTRWLSPEERALAMRRMEEDVGVKDKEHTGINGYEDENQDSFAAHQARYPGLADVLLGVKSWWMAFAMTGYVISLSFNAYFQTLTKTLGYSTTVTLLLCAPPFVFAAIVTFCWSRYSDHMHQRCLHITLSFGLGVVGFIIAISTMNTAARYVSLFLMAQSYAGQVMMFAWISNTFPRPPSTRAIAIAFVNCFSQLGNVAGSYIWPDNWGETYTNSYAICISCSGFGIVLSWGLHWYLDRQNKRMDREEEEGKAVHPYRYWL
ncbi:MFS general substrate transporter [Fistulina hepatica ATCC 64428]|uniref:MFS general substrate transporter n=1 Tax=Fistulina hepatica ATCC 64428 TaxID=1128425 RepID=A0A0D7AIM4_9AGAR|nr:MFS general substrate transporter [Fistulina hepatica ATCC 64428]